MEPHLRSPESSEKALKWRYRFRKSALLYKLFVFIALLTFRILSSMYMRPYRRGFFCNDNSLKYPFKGETINTKILLSIIIPMPSLIIILCGELRYHRSCELFSCKEMNTFEMLLDFFGNYFRQLLHFAVGIMMTLCCMDLSKFTLGSLRPHFIAVCQPRMLDGTTCLDTVNHHRYIEDYSCIANGYTTSNIHYARLSFPSAHAGLTFYTALYLSIYIHRHFNWHHGRWLKHFLQFLLALMAWYVALTRISDHWHHTSDVLVGSGLGILGALFTAAYIGRLYKPLHLTETSTP